MVEELGLLGAKLLPSEGGQPEVLGGSPARLRTVPVRAPSPTPKAGKKGKAAERTADPQALAALELEWREQRKATLSLQLLGLTWQQNAAKIQARPGTSRACTHTHQRLQPRAPSACNITHQGLQPHVDFSLLLPLPRSLPPPLSRTRTHARAHKHILHIPRAHAHSWMQAGLAEILVGLDELCAVLAAQKHSAWRKQHEEEAAELRKEAQALNVHLAQMKQTVQKTEDPAEGWKIFTRIQQKFDRLHTKFDDLCTRAGLRSASVDDAEKMHQSAAKIQAHKRGKNARRDARKAKASAGRGSPVARNALLDVGDSSGRASPDVPGERAAVM